jgi:DNA-binding NarL/FixJ family response regulator
MGEEKVRTLRVVLVDDHRLALDGLRLALGNAPGIEVAGETREGRSVLQLVARTKPDVVLLDIELPDLGGLAVLELLRTEHPELTVVMFTGSDDNAVVDEALRRGASGFLHKSIDPADLPAAIRLAVEAPTPQPVRRKPTAQELRLTPKERQVLEHLTQGMSNAEIGRALWLSQQTVKFHLTNIYRKLGVANRTEAARFALSNALVSSAEPD